MSDVAIEVEGLGKRYRIGTAAERYDSLRAALSHAATAPFRNLARLRGLGRIRNESSVIWALRDVSFQVKQGEVLGIIGSNGAGKSTLLKVLSRITSPTTGRARVRGQVGSLLEVGTGFHAELTGRENVYLNGSILGMDRAYIDARFEEIVDFSGVAAFIDTPVKRYSSGMYLRLAFSVAAHLEPDVLVVDEVLAVGDAEFQKKCLGKMGEVAGEGRTVLFVSHNLGAVTHLCPRALLLDEGLVVAEGAAANVVQTYLRGSGAGSAAREWSPSVAPGDGQTRLVAVRVCQPAGQVQARIDMQRPFSIEVEYELEAGIEELNVAVTVSNVRGEIVAQTAQNMAGGDITRVPCGRHVSICTFPANALNAAEYWVDVWADEPHKRYVWLEDRVVNFRVEMTHPGLARYNEGTFRGALGPGLVRWHRRASAWPAELPPQREGT